MSYLVFCTFDLKNASSQDYHTAYSDLAAGLQKVQKADNGADVVIPTTSVMGTFNGSSATSVRDDMCDRVQAAFKTRGFKSEIFLRQNYLMRSRPGRSHPKQGEVEHE